MSLLARSLPVRLHGSSQLGDSFFDSFLDDFFTKPRLVRGGEARRFQPAIDIKETEESFVIYADVPGFSKDSFEINIDGDKLTLSGERSHNNEKDSDHIKYHERSFGSFQRTFSLPKEVDVKNVTAAAENGVLEIVLPKNELAKESVRKIPVD